MNLLSVTGLTVYSSDHNALIDDLTFSLEPGARLGLIGESGSGKSLTALAILGLLPRGLFSDGSIQISSVNREPFEVIGAHEDSLTKIRGSVATIVFQEPLTSLDPLMRIGHQIGQPLKLHQGLRGHPLQSAVLHALQEVQIANPERVIRAYPHQISGGERQRVAIAMALACQPQLLIADEPTTALDVSIQSQVIELLDDIVAKRNMALLFISHDLAVVNQITSHILVLKSGKVVERGPISEILLNPQELYTKELVHSAKVLDSALDFFQDGGHK